MPQPPSFPAVDSRAIVGKAPAAEREVAQVDLDGLAILRNQHLESSEEEGR